jgi:hypothetical protein
MLLVEWLFECAFHWFSQTAPEMKGTRIPIWWCGFLGTARFNRVCLIFVAPLLTLFAVASWAAAWAHWDFDMLIIGFFMWGWLAVAVHGLYGPGLFIVGTKGMQITNDVIPWRDVHSYRWNEADRLAELLLVTRHERYALRIAAKDVPTVKSLLAEHAPAFATPADALITDSR